MKNSRTKINFAISKKNAGELVSKGYLVINDDPLQQNEVNPFTNGLTRLYRDIQIIKIGNLGYDVYAKENRRVG